ncbi:hypothetical protein [Sphingomonas bacterium]|uniref:hypothetical protein n=1 Tax=Sphingomonas bacterium TaxID=1895847 RepID=UPI001576F48E|nr:hypothetical protein [Sphingomonas bacterium]
MLAKSVQVLCAATVAFTLASSALAKQATLQDALLDRLEGAWVITGTIAGERTIHDLTAEWVNQHQYLRLHEVSREREQDGRPKYEATVYIGWNQPTAKYGIVWLDDFGGLSTQSIGLAPKEGDQLPFVFTNPDGSFTRTTMTYSPATKGWAWTIDEDRAGKLSRFAALTLARVGAARR